ncbi:MAG TPA: hypothetical protein VKB51_12955 [bacterium]|nr:hypothetical protein [bacterium]
MIYSSYQVERLLERLRRARGWLPWPAYQRWGGMDPVRMSRAAAQAGRDAEAAGPVAVPPLRPPALAAVRDARRFAPLVEAERERRAGSFMRPPYPDESPAPHIPKIERKTAPRKNPRRLVEAD